MKSLQRALKNNRQISKPAPKAPEALPPNTPPLDSFVIADSTARSLKSIGQVGAYTKPVPLDVAELKASFGKEMRSISSVLFKDITHSAFGEKAKALDQNNLPQAANVRLVERALLRGADGAYSPSNGGTILLASDLNATERAATYREEAGHHLDNFLGGLDSPGDEGEIFARGFEQDVTANDLRDLKSENDRGHVLVEGIVTPVEFRRRYTRSIATRHASRSARSFVDEMNKIDRAWSAFTDGKIASPGSQPWADIAAATNPSDPLEVGSVAAAMEFSRALQRGRLQRRLKSIGRKSGLNPREQNHYARQIMQHAERTRRGEQAALRFSYLLKNKT